MHTGDGIQGGSRFVQKQQIRMVTHRQNDPQLLSITGTEVDDFCVDVEIEFVDQFLFALTIPIFIKRRHVAYVLLDGHPVDVTGFLVHYADARQLLSPQ